MLLSYISKVFTLINGNSLYYYFSLRSFLSYLVVNHHFGFCDCKPETSPKHLGRHMPKAKPCLNFVSVAASVTLASQQKANSSLHESVLHCVMQEDPVKNLNTL